MQHVTAGGYNYSNGTYGQEGWQAAGMPGSAGGALGIGLLPNVAQGNQRCGSASSIGRRSSGDGVQADSNGEQNVSE